MNRNVLVLVFEIGLGHTLKVVTVNVDKGPLPTSSILSCAHPIKYYVVNITGNICLDDSASLQSQTGRRNQYFFKEGQGLSPLRLAGFRGDETHQTWVNLEVNAPEHDAEAQRLVPPGPPVLLIAPTANWAGKIWRAERFAELAKLPGKTVATVLPTTRVREDVPGDLAQSDCII